MSIVPLGYSRTSVPLQTDRILSNINYTRSEISKTELQIMTNLRYFYGSAEPSAASTAQTTLMLMERKTQNLTNIGMSQSYLTSSNSTLSKLNTLAIDAKNSGLEGLNVTTSASQRKSLALTVSDAINEAFTLANNQYLDRYLFGGSTTGTRPFEWSSDSYSVVYRGSVSGVYSWSNVNSLTQSNVSGVDAFAAVSSPVKGDDLNAAIKNETLLADLNGGKGFEKGSVRLNYTDANGKTSTQTVDLSKCVTVEDLRTQLSKNAPLGTEIRLDTTDHGLEISFKSDHGGSLAITEIGNGKTAQTLGINTKTPIVSGAKHVSPDLNPTLKNATQLDDLLGTKARTILSFAGANNDIVFSANFNGDSYTDANGNQWQLNGMEFAVVSDPKTSPGSEWVEYEESTNRITIHIHPDDSTAQGIINAVNTASEEGEIPPVTASIDSQDTAKGNGGYVPLLPGTLVVSEPAKYGSGENFDKNSGIQVLNGNTAHMVDFSNCKTVDDLLYVLNNPELGLYASINSSGNGIDVSSRVSGTDFMIGENGGTTATQLGLRTLTNETFLSELDFNRGVADYDGPGTNASASYMTTYEDTGMLLTAKEEGTEWNDFKINFVPTEDPDGNVTIAWDEELKVINIGIVSGTTRACEVVQAFAQQPGPNEAFDLVLDETLGINTGQGVVYDGMMTTEGGADGGIDFTITRKDGISFDIDIKGAKTIGDVIDLINNHPDNTGGLVEARLVPYGNGIELIDNSIGSGKLKVERSLLSTAAIDLGLIQRGEEYQEQTSGGKKATVTARSEETNSAILFSSRYSGEYANDVNVVFRDMNDPDASGKTGFYYDPGSSSLVFDIEPGVTTANDIIKLFEEHASPAVKDMFTVQNGINLDGTTSNGNGLIDVSTTEEPVRLTGGTNAILDGSDPNPLETESFFNALIRLQVALENNDEREIERATNLLADSVTLMDTCGAEIGIRQNGLDALLELLEDENIQLTETLKEAQGTNLTEAATKLGSLDNSYQATLALTGTMFGMSLLNYL